MSKIIDFKKLAELEKTYGENGISINALNQMVNYVLDASNKTSNSIAHETLENLGVIKVSTETKKTEKLNS